MKRGYPEPLLLSLADPTYYYQGDKGGRMPSPFKDSRTIRDLSLNAPRATKEAAESSDATDPKTESEGAIPL
jgi:hypothetical protein